MRACTFIDLFCGCGGFSLGMERAGFKCLAAIDSNPEAMAVFKKNFPHVPHALREDLTQFPPEKLSALFSEPLDPQLPNSQPAVDVIVGGPPCQGFSKVRRVDGTNNGSRLVDDKRRHLYKEFLRYVEFFRPKVFVIENVLGIRSAAGGEYFMRVQKDGRALGYRVHPQVERAFELGVPQKRERQLFIGTRLDLPDYFPSRLRPAPRACDSPPLWEAIGDLPPVRAGEGDEQREYDMERRRAHVERFGRRYLYSVLEIHRAKQLTAHRARPHNDRDLRDFARLKEGENSAQAMRRGVQFEFPYSKEHFDDRFTKQDRWDACSTIVAHLSKDGLMFIHPKQNRSLTPREAARIQSFPDWFEFPVTRMHQFRVIGNAVPPLVSEAIGIAAKSYIEKAMRNSTLIKFDLAPLPKDEKQAVNWLLPLLDLDKRALRKVPDLDFKRAWYSIAFIYVGLHPDSALEHGEQIANDMSDYAPVSAIEPRLTNPYYRQSGWPVVLAPVAKEAWRRYESGRINDDEFYCSEAQMAGICHRSPELAEEVRIERLNLAAT